MGNMPWEQFKYGLVEPSLPCFLRGEVIFLVTEVLAAGLEPKHSPQSGLHWSLSDVPCSAGCLDDKWVNSVRKGRSSSFSALASFELTCCSEKGFVALKKYHAH